MKNAIFITLEGGVIQDISVTDDLENIKAVVVDFDVEKTDAGLSVIDDELMLIYDYGPCKIADGDVEHFEEIIRRCEEDL